MATESSVREDVKSLVQEITARRNLKGTLNINYQSVSESGDGYASKTGCRYIT